MLQVARFAKGARMEYVGIDVDPRKQANAKTRHAKMDYRLANLEVYGEMIQIASTPKEPIEAYDAIASTETLEHLDASDGKNMLLDFYTLLKPGGHVILTSPQPQLRRDNIWHLHEWKHLELEAFLLTQTEFHVVDNFFMKCAARDARRNITSSVESNRVPPELLRSIPAIAQEGTISVFILQK